MTRDKTLAKALGLLLHCYMLKIEYSQEFSQDFGWYICARIFKKHSKRSSILSNSKMNSTLTSYDLYVYERISFLENPRVEKV